MLNNQNLKNKNIDYVPYQLQVKLFDAKCKDCCYTAYQVRSRTGMVFTYKNYEEAIAYATNSRAPIKRLCVFNDEMITMSEIVHNHCVFWDVHIADTDEDSEVEEISKTGLAQLKYKLHILKSFVKLKK